MQAYVDSGEVDLIDWPYENADKEPTTWNVIQRQAYNDALERAECKWLAIIDVDEFLVPAADHDLICLLARYEGNPSVGGICIPWVFFGTSHVEKIPDDKLMIETLVYNAGSVAGGDRSAIWNSGAYKSIVRRGFVAQANVHFCVYHSGISHTLISYDLGQINHYWPHDETFLREVKVPRKQEMAGWSPEAMLNYAEQMNAQKDNVYGKRILRFVAPLRRLMGY